MVYKCLPKLVQIISVGDCIWENGFNIALDAVSKLKKDGYTIKYTIICNNVSEELLYHSFDLSLNQDVVFLNSLPKSLIIDYIKSSDLFLLPRLIKGELNYVLDSMACETIVIATEESGGTEIIKDGVNGFIVPVLNSEAISDAVIRILNLPSENFNSVLNAAKLTSKANLNL